MNGIKQKKYVTFRGILQAGLIAFSLVIGFALTFFSPIILLASIAIPTGFFLLLFYPYLGALAYLVFEYMALAAKYPALRVLQLGKVIAISTFIAWIINSIIKPNFRPVSHRLNWLMLSLLIVALISSFNALSPTKAFSDSMDLARLFFTYIILINLIDSKKKWLWFIGVFLVLNFKMSQFQIRSFNYGYSEAGDIARYIAEGVGVGSVGFFANAGDFGVAMCVAIPLAYYTIITTKSKIYKIVAVIMLISFILPIVKSGMRGSILGLIAIALVFWLKSSKKLMIGLVISSLLVIYWVTAPQVAKDRFYSAASSEKDPTASHRIELWETGVQMFLEHPLRGVGMGNFGLSYAQLVFGGDLSQAWVPHNIFIQVSSELGFPGLFCLILIIYLVFKTNYLTRQLALRSPPDGKVFINYAHALDLSLVGYVVSGSFLAVLYYPHLYMIMALVVSLNQIAQKTFSIETAVATAKSKSSSSFGLD